MDDTVVRCWHCKHFEEDTPWRRGEVQDTMLQLIFLSSKRRHYAILCLWGN